MRVFICLSVEHGSVGYASAVYLRSTGVGTAQEDCNLAGVYRAAHALLEILLCTFSLCAFVAPTYTILDEQWLNALWKLTVDTVTIWPQVHPANLQCLVHSLFPSYVYLNSMHVIMVNPDQQGLKQRVLEHTLCGRDLWRYVTWSPLGKTKPIYRCSGSKMPLIYVYYNQTCCVLFIRTMCRYYLRKLAASALRTNRYTLYSPSVFVLKALAEKSETKQVSYKFTEVISAYYAYE